MKNIIQNTFEKPFNPEHFWLFIRNLLEGIEEKFDKSIKMPHDALYKDVIKSYGRIGKYVDPDEKIVDILIVKLHRNSSLERARTTQRNFIARYLNGTMGGVLRDAALVAFVSENDDGKLNPEWRFSLVKMDYKYEIINGKRKPVKELSPAKRYSFLVGEGENSHTAQKQLLDLLNKNEPLTLDKLVEAFSIEKVRQEFYDEYENRYFELKKELDRLYAKNTVIHQDFDKNKIDEAGRINFAKKTLGQLVFLYFLQKKGWLGVKKDDSYGNGDKKFLTKLFNKEFGNYDNFFNNVLEPLFYGALADDRRKQGDLFKFEEIDKKPVFKIPFLNGGLFEPTNDYDWKNTNITIDNNVFKKIFKTFDLYNFTVKEDEPLEKEVAIDPEMLGKVFEELLDVKERKSNGAFYTPREIVHYMCQESLVNYLANELKGKVPKEDIKNYIDIADSTYENKRLGIGVDLPENVKNHAGEIDTALKNIKVCDPAIGSGAFPVGMMNEIVRARLALNSELTESERIAYYFKRQVIEHSIHGVDKDEGAVEIARLRFWLSLVVDEEHVTTIKPLPNLDYKIVCGSSLCDLDGVLRDNDKYKKFNELANKHLEPAPIEEKKKLKKEINQILENIFNTAKSVGKKTNFDFKLFFHDVFKTKGGFDIVIGNPPYIKEPTDKKAFEGLNDPKKPHKYYQGKMDIWYMFACIGLDLLKPEGIECFIATNNWVTNAGASILRNKIVEESQIIDYIDFGNCKVFSSADIQTMVYVIKKSSKHEKYKLNYSKLLKDKIKTIELENFLRGIENTEIYQRYPVEFDREYFKDQYIKFLPQDITSVLNKINSRGNIKLFEKEITNGIHPHHGEVSKSFLEILGNDFKVGDGIFYLSEQEKQKLCLTEKEIKDLIRPFYNPTELFKYYGNSINKYWIIYTTSEFKNPKLIEQYPNIKNHLDKFKKVITSDNKPYGLHRARQENFFKGEKIMSLRKCSKEPIFTYTDFDCYVGAMYYIIKTSRVNQKYLTGLLNSNLVKFWLLYEGKMQGNNFQVDKEPLLKIPIANTNKDIQDLISILVDYIRYLYSLEDKNTYSDYKIKFFINLINGLVYEIYFNEELKSANCLIEQDLKNIIKTSNTEINEEIIENAFKKLEYKDSPIVQKLFMQKQISPIDKIEKTVG